MLKNLRLPLILAVVLMISLVLTGCTVSRASDQAAQPAGTAAASAPAEATSAPTESAAAPIPAESKAPESAGALTIPIAELDGDAHFYSADEDGVQVEVIALKLADGSIRTAFNACQVCFDSGRGYYVQEGDQLVCQNCGNRFTMDQVGLSSGGCNPVPIGEADRSSDGTTITISQDVLKKGEPLFQNRK